MVVVRIFELGIYVKIFCAENNIMEEETRRFYLKSTTNKEYLRLATNTLLLSRELAEREDLSLKFSIFHVKE